MKQNKTTKPYLALFITLLLLVTNLDFSSQALAKPVITNTSQTSKPLSLPGIFSDHMVLQRQIKVPVWGNAKPGATVTVQLIQQTKTTTVNQNGRWRVYLDPLNAGGPYQMKVTSGQSTITFFDVLVGEVWLGSGQSNMEMPINGNRKNMICNQETKQYVGDANYPQIRISAITRDNLKTPNGGWIVMSPKVRDAMPATMSCAAIELYKQKNIPVGIIVRAISSSPSGTWLRRNTIDNTPQLQAQIKQYTDAFPSLLKLYQQASKEYQNNQNNQNNKTKNTQKMTEYSKALSKYESTVYSARRIGRQPPHPPKPGMNRPSWVRKDSDVKGKNFKRLIKPIVPYAIRGVVWDQGEAGTGVGGASQLTMMQTLLHDWRADWGYSFPLIYIRKNQYSEHFTKTMNARPAIYMADNRGLDQRLHPIDKSLYAKRVVQIMNDKVYSPNISQFYIAPDGNDANPGTFDKPFATLIHARDIVRQYKKTNPNKNITVFLRGGTYPITQTVIFSLKDSGGPNQIITYQAYPNETPIFSAGAPIKQWKKLTDYPKELPPIAQSKIWVADVSFIRNLKSKQKVSPSVATQMDRVKHFLTLYQGDKQLQRARGKGFFLGKVPRDYTSRTQFYFPKGILKNWSDLANTEITVFTSRSWMSSTVPLKSVDEKKGIATTAVSCTYILMPRRNNAEKPFTHIENALALLDEPGEWVLDSRTDTLYLWPTDGKPSDEIRVPVLTEMVRIEGNIDYAGPKDTPVKNLVFRGLTFTHSDRFPWHGMTGWGVQHDWERFDSPSAMLRLRGTENCVIEDCTLTNAGSTGIRLDLHAQNNRIVGNHISQLGGVGIFLGGYGPGKKDVNKYNVIANNLIHDIGQLYHGSVGIFAWQSGENNIHHNELFNLPYAGICVTGRIVWDQKGNAECSRTIRWDELKIDKATWSYAQRARSWSARKKYLHARNNLVYRNDIHHIMQACADGNAIYISGAGSGNKIIENYCHDTPSSHMNNTIRCDDDQNETLIHRNIIYRNRGYAEGLMIKGNNTMTENLMIDLRTNARHRGYIRFYAGDVRGAVIQRNVTYSCDKTQNPTHDGVSKNGRPIPKFTDTNADYNLYHNTQDPNWGKRHLLKTQAVGIEKHSLSADPLFVDIDKQDFRFKHGSPALILGLKQPVSIDLVGLQSMYRLRWNRQ